MKIEIQITREKIAAPKFYEEFYGGGGAIAEFSGIVRDLENGEKISALEYEAYSPMAENEMRRILESLAQKHPILAATVIHRIGVIPVGEAAIYLGVMSKHRGEAFAVLTEFMNGLKQEVPIWKVRSLPSNTERGSVSRSNSNNPKPDQTAVGHRHGRLSLDEALAEISDRCQPLAGIRENLSAASGHVLREDIIAKEDFPPCDKSTRDGYAILADDKSESFSVVDTLHAADWKPRTLKRGEAVRVATGASLPCENLRVVMQEDVDRAGDVIKILEPDDSLNVRKRGEELRIGDTILTAEKRLDAGALALLASVGCTQPLISPRLRVMHFTTGDEIVSPDQKPKPGQTRDSNSILIRALLENFQCEVTHRHLPENFEEAKLAISNCEFQTSDFHLVLISGGASVGDLDFTRPLLEWLGFKIVFNRVSIRPGAPLIFGANDNCIAFGLPGNPVSHFVCFHLFVASAIAKLTGAKPSKFFRGTLASALDDSPNPRETLWPARCDWSSGAAKLTPLGWSSSGDVKCLAETNALIRLPPKQSSLAAGMSVEFLPADS